MLLANIPYSETRSTLQSMSQKYTKVKEQSSYDSANHALPDQQIIQTSFHNKLLLPLNIFINFQYLFIFSDNIKGEMALIAAETQRSPVSCYIHSTSLAASLIYQEHKTC